ncbi:MAG TPA: class I SAM-dependent methyltransferase, partial [Patescibacteria group bacterium]|nr:class I SAM-dependent methyltransferase [Patescibacteria group bacterium]
KARPRYPDALFAWIADEAPARGCVWDAGCGNGQASVALARHFECVVGTDPSERQIGQAVADPRVEYRVEPAEHTSFAGHAADAVTVAQALHWFDLDAFIREMRRVAKPGALFAAWSYANCSVTPALDAIVAELYGGVLGPYWPPERRLVEEGYRTIPFPFKEIVPPQIRMESRWTLEQLLGYFSTWSATNAFIKSTGRDPLPAFAAGLQRLWPDANSPRLITWPLSVRIGRVAPASYG